MTPALTLTIRDLNHEGQGVAQGPDGRVVFVDGALPGETVSARQTIAKKSYATAVLEEIQTPSVDRVTPFCEIAGRCGGCPIQHLSHAAQIGWKAKSLTETLRRIANLTIPEPETLYAHDRAYRRTLRLVCTWPWGEANIGFFAPRSHEVVAVAHCPVSEEPLNEALSWVRAQTAANPKAWKGLTALSLRSGKGGVHLLAAFEKGIRKDFREWVAVQTLPPVLAAIHATRKPEGNRLFSQNAETLAGPAHLREDRLGFLDLRLSPGAFAQAHPAVHDAFLTRLEAFAASLPSGKAVDLFAGTGLSSLVLARAGHSVISVESDPQGHEDARENTRKQVKGVRPVQAFAETWLTRHAGTAPGLVFLNPPRKGLAPGGAQALAALGAAHVVYQSCHPSSLARDAAVLLTAGYTPTHALLLDFFPHTAHIEAVLFLRKAAA